MTLSVSFPPRHAPPEVITIQDDRIACDGGRDGHPRVYLTMSEEGFVDCPYCGRRYIKKNHHGAAAMPHVVRAVDEAALTIPKRPPTAKTLRPSSSPKKSRTQKKARR